MNIHQKKPHTLNKQVSKQVNKYSNKHAHKADYKKYLALFSIYLMISLTFFTARAMAVLNYDISGESGVSGFAKSHDDVISITTNSDGNVSFLLSNSEELPLDCSIGNTSKPECTYTFSDSDMNAISAGKNDVEFTLKQDSGSPTFKKGQLYLDDGAPRPEYFTAERNGTGILFKYKFIDYQSESQDSIDTGIDCTASGIGMVELYLQGKDVVRQTITDHNCSIEGEYYASFSGTYNDKITYYMNVEDRLGNRYESGVQKLDGDFKGPSISNTFKILESSTDVTILSSNSQVKTDIEITIEDANLDVSSVYADLSSLNSNPAMNIPYKNMPATCVKASESAPESASGTEYTCTFPNIMARPAAGNLSITITASDTSGNTASKIATKTVNMVDDAGSVKYVGPLKEHCTDDLSTCYARPGMQLLQIILDSSSSFNNTVLNMGIADAQTFALCTRNTTGKGAVGNTQGNTLGNIQSNTWVCNAVYTMPQSGTVNVYLASGSYDDYGNELESSMERQVVIDNVQPELISTVAASNSNNNDCAVTGDDMIYSFKVREKSEDVKVKADTSDYSVRKSHEGKCELSEGSSDEWDCSITISDFVSTPMNTTVDLVVEDLAGNELTLKQKLNICQSSAANAPNIITSIKQDRTPSIDRKTASKIPVKVFIPLTINIKSGSSIMYLNVERCSAKGQSGLDIMSPGSSFMPSYGTNPQMVLYIGKKGAQLAEGSFEVNCTISARIRSGTIVYAKEQKSVITLKVETYNNPLGTIDSAAQLQIEQVKAHIRDTDSSISKYQKWDDILGNVCKIAETIGKINTIMQAFKSVWYAICLVMQSIPWTAPYAQSAWSFVNGPTSAFHLAVDKFVWPPGTLPTKLSVGSAVKTTCMVYTCKHLDIGTYTGMISQIGTEQLVQNVFTVEERTSGIPTKNVESYNPTASDLISPALRQNQVEVQSPYKPASTTAPKTFIKIMPYQEMTSEQKDSILHKNDILIDSLNGHQWIINPYKSVHYDDTCMPAILYNLKKDRQINCMYLRCLNEQAKSGLPKMVCDGNYKMNKCLYLDSAEYLLHGQGSAFKAFFKGMGEAFMNALPGLGIQTTYTILCRNYYGQGNNLVGGWKSVTCGIAGATMSAKEIVDSFSNPFFSLKPTLTGPDYCKGLDYSAKDYVDDTSAGTDNMEGEADA